ncbi:MAG: helix-turn-helix transcriptional regulator [Rhodospirillaceae bacterium]|jgi:transcriptional regulator with XRE-family HTH domain|nr:helix-turn-helix transcriptional regulator [Rhodospirillaceae bacterium]MBT6137349.1 helix-turn-helix transcriptional regulator [Rhodospirillaceae bacterium]
MDRRETVTNFRQRLGEAMRRSAMNRSSLARHVGIDRSTISQLLSEGNDRLPRADTVAAIAATLQVSLDWLLGISQEESLGAEILERSFQFQQLRRTEVDVHLARWHAEAAGYKIRYVPYTLPDQIKTERVIAHEYGTRVEEERDEAWERARDRLAYIRQPDTEIEICSTQQGLAGFARGEGIWQGLSPDDRIEQLNLVADLTEELYPRLRWTLHNGREVHSVPVTIFGPHRAAVYAGHMYLVFNTTEHIRVLTRQFDDLVRQATVHAHEFAEHARGLISEVTS